VEFDMAEANRQLQHANEQIALTRQYPGHPPRVPDNVIDLPPRHRDS
jgi:hypothetical protein